MSYKIIEVHGQLHVLVDRPDRPNNQKANYLNTGMALAGILKESEIIENLKLKSKS